jgi:nitric oxide dioxygenase
MTPEQVRLLQQSIEAIGPLLNEIGRSFYTRLFELAPDTRALFKTDMEGQQQLFMAIFRQFSVLNERSMLTLPVTASSSREVSIPGVAGLGERHVAYGVRPEHFNAAQNAFLWSVDKHLGEVVDAKTKEAWVRAFEMIIQGMTSVMTSKATGAALPHAGRKEEQERDGDESDGDSLEQLFRRQDTIGR